MENTEPNHIIKRGAEAGELASTIEDLEGLTERVGAVRAIIENLADHHLVPHDSLNALEAIVREGVHTLGRDGAAKLTARLERVFAERAAELSRKLEGLLAK